MKPVNTRGDVIILQIHFIPKIHQTSSQNHYFNKNYCNNEQSKNILKSYILTIKYSPSLILLVLFYFSKCI